ncbi:hypothetical protein BH11MYX4_BH11MYX4_24930 [soil metagenome]
MRRCALALVVAAASLLLVARPARAEEAPPADPTADWPVHFDPPPPRPAASPSGATPGGATPLSEEDQWERKLHRHHLDGALGFAATYGAAAAGGAFAGLVLSHDHNNPGSDSSAYLKAVALPLFTPVVGPIFLGGLVAVGYTAILFDTGGGKGESGRGDFLVVGIAFAPLAYGFSALAVADGIMQGVFLKQAFGGSDPPRPSSAAAPKPTMGRSLLAVTPMLVPEVQAPAWLAATPARGLPSALGVQLPMTW